MDKKNKTGSAEAAFAAAVEAVTPEEATAALTRSHMAERVAHGDAVRAAAQRDAETLVGTVVGEHPLTREQLALFAHAVGVAAEMAPRPRVPGLAAAPEDVVALSDTALRGEARRLQREIGAAFRVRFADNPAGRARVKAILLGSSDADLQEDTAAFGELIESAAHRAWFATLPRNEGAMWARLQAVTAEAGRRFGSDEKAQKKGAARSRRVDLGRVLAVVYALERRFRIAGRYRFRGTATALDYRAFAARTRAKGGGPT